MKKVTLSAAALMIGAIGFAQTNNSMVHQDGTQNISEVSQLGTMNTSDVTQLGPESEAYVDQTGNNNTVTLLQNHDQSHGVLGINYADITQDGSGNTADVFQRNRGQYAAAGLNNNLILLQDGADNYADIHQAIARGNDVKLSQLGDDNEAFVSQHQGSKLSGYGAASTSIQDGNENYLNLDQGNFNTAGITQEGDFNHADIEQNGFASDNVQLWQNGSDNQVLLSQSSGTADIQQHQDGNIVNGLSGLGSTANQSGGAMLTVVQDGDYNELFVGQDGASTAIVNQSGDENTSTVGQNGNGHNSLINQMGNLNTSSVMQSGASHNSVVNQMGNGNSSVVTQSN